MQRVRNQVCCPRFCDMETKPVTIAFLDTGAEKHPDFSDRIVAFKDFINGKKIPYDDSGHGTHVCGIAAGDGNSSNGKYCGIAPASRIVVGKVLDGNGDGLAEQMIKGIDWIIEIREQFDIRIVNISVGIGNLKDKLKQQELVNKVEELCGYGIIVVCAAGNLGPDKGSISPLGVSKKVITVGCHDGEYFKDYENRCEIYSGRGPTRDAIKKPDIVAPGTEIISCCIGKDSYMAKSGTSMATAIVSGAVALIWQKYPQLSREQVIKRLLYSATDLKEPWIKQGWGMLNIKRALE